MFDHQVCKVLSIKQNYTLREVFNVVDSLRAEIRCGDKNALRRT